MDRSSTSRVALALSFAAVVSVGLMPADAAPPVCRLLKDPSGDGSVKSLGGPNIGALDIVSADVATGAKNLAAVLRLTSLAAEPSTAIGRWYVLRWTVGSVQQGVDLWIYTDGSFDARFSASESDTAGTTVTASVNRATSTVTWVIPRHLNPLLTRRSHGRPITFTGLRAGSMLAVNPSQPAPRSSAAAVGADSADGGSTYTDRKPSCVKVT